jgi:hypothetical protein
VSINLRPFKGHDISGRHLCQSNNLVAKTRHYSLRALSCSDRVFLGHSRAGPSGLAHLAIYSHHGSMASLVMQSHHSPRPSTVQWSAAHTEQTLTKALRRVCIPSSPPSCGHPCPKLCWRTSVRMNAFKLLFFHSTLVVESLHVRIDF